MSRPLSFRSKMETSFLVLSLIDHNHEKGQKAHLHQYDRPVYSAHITISKKLELNKDIHVNYIQVNGTGIL